MSGSIEQTHDILSQGIHYEWANQRNTWRIKKKHNMTGNGYTTEKADRTRNEGGISGSKTMSIKSGKYPLI